MIKDQDGNEVPEEVVEQIKSSIEVPRLTGEGDLTVENSNSVDLGSDAKKVEEPEPEEKEKQETPLPSIGDKFMLNGHEYKVVYINEGKRRFSCVPCKGVY